MRDALSPPQTPVAACLFSGGIVVLPIIIWKMICQIKYRKERLDRIHPLTNEAQRMDAGNGR
jgi:hypothetical protein